MRFNPYLLHYRAAFAFSTFLYPHHQQHSLRSACPAGRRYGLTVFHVNNKSGLGSAFPPVVVLSAQPKTGKGLSDYVAFWLKPVSIFGLFAITVFISSSLALTISLSLATHLP